MWLTLSCDVFFYNADKAGDEKDLSDDPDSIHDIVVSVVQLLIY